MDRDRKNLLKETLIKVNIKMVDLMDSEHINGQMAQCMKGCLKMAFVMEKENGLKMKQNISETILKDLKKVMESYTCRVETFTKETLQMITDKGMEKCFGLMGLFTKENGEMEVKMEKDKFISQETKL